MKRLFFILLLPFLITAFGISGTSGDETVKAASEGSPVLSAQTVRNRILAGLESASPGSYLPGEVIVKFRDDTAGSRSVAVHQQIGAAVLRKLGGPGNAELVKIPRGMTVSEAVQQYMADPAVEYAEPNYIRHIQSTFPNDTYFSQQWSLNNTGQTMNAVPGADMDMPEAWDITTGSRDFVVAVIDTGVDYGHPDLGLNIWRNTDEIADDGIDNDSNGYIDDIIGWNFVDDDNDPLDDNLHGTHVSGIIGALGNNATGVTGVNWKVRIMPLKVCNANGGCTDADIADAVNYAADNGANVINASLAGHAYSQSVYDAINYAKGKDVLFVAAAGNGGGPFCNDGNANDDDLFRCYPASYNLDNIISVAASDQDDQFASFSNYGAISIDVVAPGNHTLSTWPTYLFPQGYDTLEGTSMASPHVAGLAALLMDYYRHFTIYQIKGLIETFVDRLPQFNGYVVSGGRINAYRALSSLLMPTGLIAITEAPSYIKLKWVDHATGEDSYGIERKAAGESVFSTIDTIPADSEEYTDTTVVAGTAYTYRVRAINSVGGSLYTNEATVTAVTGLTSSGGGGCSVTGRAVSDSTAAAGILLFILPAVVFYIRRK